MPEARIVHWLKDPDHKFSACKTPTGGYRNVGVDTHQFTLLVYGPGAAQACPACLRRHRRASLTWSVTSMSAIGGAQ